MKKFLLCLVILILLIPAMPVAAQEVGLPEDNACNPGGAMYRENPAEGCNSEWHWVCGYYLARFYTRSYNMGGYDTSLVPDWCHSLLPPRPEVPANISLPGVPPVIETPICVADAAGSFLIYPSNVNKPYQALFFVNTTCTGEGLGATIVMSDTEAGASILCDQILGFAGNIAYNLVDFGYIGAPANYFYCDLGFGQPTSR